MLGGKEKWVARGKERRPVLYSAYTARELPHFAFIANSAPSVQ